MQWVEKEKIPWITLVELDADINNEVLYSELLFSGGNYLVDAKGIVIAKDISADELIPTSCNKHNGLNNHSTIFSLIAGILFVIMLGMI